jgi:hypothetical protein
MLQKPIAMDQLAKDNLLVWAAGRRLAPEAPWWRA